MPRAWGQMGAVRLTGGVTQAPETPRQGQRRVPLAGPLRDAQSDRAEFDPMELWADPCDSGAPSSSIVAWQWLTVAKAAQSPGGEIGNGGCQERRTKPPRTGPTRRHRREQLAQRLSTSFLFLPAPSLSLVQFTVHTYTTHVRARNYSLGCRV